MYINKDLISLHYINLREREERKKTLIDNLAVNGFNSISVERFEAYKEQFGELGCAKSHFMLLSNLLCKSNSRYHIILEDDFRFSIKFEQLLTLINIIEKTQLELDIFHLYTLRPIPEVVKKIQNKNKVANLCRITYGQSTAAYVIKKSGLIKLTQNYLEALSNLKSNLPILKNKRLRGAFNMRFAIDNYWSQIQAQRNCYAYDIQIGYIEEGYSDVTESVKSLEAQTMQRPFGHNKNFF